MQPLAVLIIAFAPGLFWLWYFYHKDVFQPEPKRLVLKTFLFGAVAGLPVVLLEVIILRLVDIDLFHPDVTTLSMGAAMLFVVAPIEESGKYLAVRFSAMRSKRFDEPVDGFVYASAAALGFASFENLLYISDVGWEVILIRGPVSTLGHVLVSGIWGYAVGRGLLYERTRRQLLLWLGLGTLAHGAFNILLLTYSPLGFAGMLVLFAGMAWWLSGRMRWARGASPFKRDALRLYSRCPGCGRRTRPGAHTCPSCNLDLTSMARVRP